jgi:hypothetical protein
LALVLRLEAALLQFNHHQAFQFAVVEQQVDIEVVAVELDAPLPSDEGKPGAKFQKEGLQFPKNSVFQVPLQKAIV